VKAGQAEQRSARSPCALPPAPFTRSRRLPVLENWVEQRAAFRLRFFWALPRGKQALDKGAILGPFPVADAAGNEYTCTLNGGAKRACKALQRGLKAFAIEPSLVERVQKKPAFAGAAAPLLEGMHAGLFKRGLEPVIGQLLNGYKKCGMAGTSRVSA